MEEGHGEKESLGKKSYYANWAKNAKVYRGSELQEQKQVEKYVWPEFMDVIEWA